jgi:toxin CcdB
MRQFAVYRNRNAATKARFPLLLDVQSDLLSDLGTRVVIPLTPATVTSRRTALQTLTPILVVDGREHLPVTPQLAGIATRELGTPVADLSGQGPAILAALDLLITGI